MCLRMMEMTPAGPGYLGEERSIFPVLGAGLFLSSAAPARAAGTGQRVEKQFNITGRPVVVIHNVANGRIEVKSWKNARGRRRRHAIFQQNWF